MALLIGGWHLTTLILDRGISFITSQCFSVFFNMLLFLIRIGKKIRCTSEISNKKASVCTEVSVPSMTKGRRTPSIQQQMQTIIAEDGLCDHPKGSYVQMFARLNFENLKVPGPQREHLGVLHSYNFCRFRVNNGRPICSSIFMFSNIAGIL